MFRKRGNRFSESEHAQPDKQMLTRRRFVAGAAGGAALLATARRARSQVVGKPARILVGFPPGGSADVAARLIVGEMKGYAPSVIVDNRPGAGGRVAVEAVKAGPADGSVMLLSPASMMVLHPHTYKSLGYDPVADFIAVSTVCAFPFVLGVGPLVPREVGTLAEFIAWCRANPQRASYGTAGAGTTLHFAGVMLARAANFEFTHVPYRGGAPALQDLVGGQIAASVGVLGTVLPQIKAGNVRALAITSATRSSFLPDVPTLAEAGYPGLTVTEWQGIFLPAGTPAPIVEALNHAVRAALATDAVKTGLARASFEPGGTSVAELAQLVQADLARWGTIVRDSGFTPEN